MAVPLCLGANGVAGGAGLPAPQWPHGGFKMALNRAGLAHVGAAQGLATIGNFLDELIADHYIITSVSDSLMAGVVK